MTARIIPVETFDLVIFGGTGDLARRKLLPGLFRRDRDGQLPDGARIIAVARSAKDTAAFREDVAGAIAEHVPEAAADHDALNRFIARTSYVPVDALGESGWADLKATLDARTDRIRAFYLAVDPRFYGPICQRLGANAMAEGARLVVEKPLGHDLASARELNDQIAGVFDEHRVYRIDHYLGKETVQNLMALRFANAMFEPLWNARHIDHVQVTVAEDIGVGGRANYYDHAGAVRDMLQNHLLQLLCLTAMEPPARFEADAVRDEKLKVLRALAPIAGRDARRLVALGQYRGRGEVPGYCAEVENPDSRTESFVALKANVDTWRWKGAPFYLRTGKRLRDRISEIAVVFKEPPHSIFPPEAGEVGGNTLAIRLQPHEGVTLSMTVKDPGPGGMRLRTAPLDMTFAGAFGSTGLRMPDAYERLVLDVIRGNQTLFMRRDEVEAAWAWIDPMRAGLADGPPPEPYDVGTSGPEGALRLIHHDGRRWRDIEA